MKPARLFIGAGALLVAAASIAVAFGTICLLLQVFLSYRRYVRYLKWLTMALLSYVLLVLTLDIPWREVAAHTVTPHLIVRGAAAAIDYYKKAFRAEEIRRMPGPRHAIEHQHPANGEVDE